MKDVQDQLESVFMSFSDDVEEALEKALDRRAKEAKSKIQRDSPSDKGNYKKNWSVKKEKHKRTVYNKKYGSLTHLLEKGHQLSSGGRAKAIPHIDKNQKEVADGFYSDCEEIVRNHGK